MKQEPHMPVTVAIQPHEVQAMREIVMHVRALSTVFADTDMSSKLKIWAQMVEDILNRIDTQ